MVVSFSGMTRRLASSPRLAIVASLAIAAMGCDTARATNHASAPASLPRTNPLPIPEMAPTNLPILRYPEDIHDSPGPWPVPPDEGKAPAGLTLHVANAVGPGPVPGWLSLDAWLVNESSRDIKIIVFPAGSGGFEASVVLTSGIAAKPYTGPLQPPPVPPPPNAITIPARTQVRFRTAIDTNALEYVGAPKVTLKWTFHYWTAPLPEGTLETTLPAR